MRLRAESRLTMSNVTKIFKACVQAIRDGQLIQRQSRSDKEFHFQNWFKHRLNDTQLNYDVSSRNTYPDFLLVHHPEGYELKGLAYPGRSANFDSNSQSPSGKHNGRTIYYVFGRYPRNPDGDHYPVLDLAICHGSFLNADNDYTHKNKSFDGFGTYGDILIRDRKMYVCPTPFSLVEGLAHQRTLILPLDHPVDDDLIEIGSLTRCETDQVIVSYSFDLRNNKLQTTKMANPHAGRKHVFKLYRVKGDPINEVSLFAKPEALTSK